MSCDRLDQSPPSRRDRHHRHLQQQQQQQQHRLGVESRDSEDGSSSRRLESSFSAAALTGSGQLLLSVASCGDRTERKYRHRNVDEEGEEARRRLPLLSVAKNHALMDDEALKVKSENLTIATHSLDAALTSETPVVADGKARDLSGDEQSSIRSTSFQTRRCCDGENGFIASDEKEPVACKLTVASRSRRSSASEETTDEEEEIDVCTDPEEHLVLRSPTLLADVARQNVAMATEKTVTGKRDDVVISMPTEAEDPSSEVKAEAATVGG